MNSNSHPSLSFSFTRHLPVLVVLFSLLRVSPIDAKKNRDAPHPHQGILTPYKPGPFTSLSLTNSDIQDLNEGKPVMKQTQAKDGEMAGGAICVQDIQAPMDQVWDQILNLNDYKGKVPKVNECVNYCDRVNKDGTRTIKTKMVVGVIPGYSYTSFYDHTYFKDKDSMTWTLDYEKTSDFDDVSGHWHLEEHPEKPGCTRVFYACDVMLKGAVPKPIVNYLSNSALRTATGWVKKESEGQAKQSGESDIESGGKSAEEKAASPVAIRFSKDDLRALISGKPVQSIITLHLNKGEVKTLRSKGQLSMQVAGDDEDATATIAALQIIEGPTLGFLERIQGSIVIGIFIAAFFIGLSSLLSLAIA
eukprot:scaffold992_cov116-Cylindrotheca_fusiformis.AAC.17